MPHEIRVVTRVVRLSFQGVVDALTVRRTHFYAEAGEAPFTNPAPRSFQRRLGKSVPAHQGRIKTVASPLHDKTTHDDFRHAITGDERTS